MTREELDWLELLYERHVLYEHEPKFQAAKALALHCTHWSYLLYHTLSDADKSIWYNNEHTVCVVNGIHIDMECNAFIKDLDWKHNFDTSRAKLVQIHPRHPIKHHLLSMFYRSPAIGCYKLTKNVIF